jgi:hypothetical protein
MKIPVPATTIKDALTLANRLQNKVLMKANNE